MMRYPLYIAVMALLAVYMTGCSGMRGDLMIGAMLPVKKAESVGGLYGLSVTGDLSDNVIIGAELQVTPDILNEKYQLNEHSGMCLMGCSPAVVNSNIDLQQMVVTLQYMRDKQHYYKFGLGRYSTVSGKASNDWFSPAYDAPPGYTMPTGLSVHAGVGYIYYQSPSVKLSVEADAMWLHGEGELVTESGMTRNMDDLSSMVVLFRFGY